MTSDKLYKKAKALIKGCMKFYNEREMLHLEMDASGVAFVGGLLKVRESKICLCNEAPKIQHFVL